MDLSPARLLIETIGGVRLSTCTAAANPGGFSSIMALASKPKRPKRAPVRSCLGPVADLESHLPAEWWRKLFNALYVKTDGDVVENNENTRREVDFIVAAAAIQPHSHILDLCCGQGRHCLELARRGFKNVMGVDRSRYLG